MKLTDPYNAHGEGGGSARAQGLVSTLHTWRGRLQGLIGYQWVLRKQEALMAPGMLLISLTRLDRI